MDLTELSQPQLDRQLEIFITNGKLPQAQTVLAPAGYTVEALAAAEEKLNAWRAGQAQTRDLLLAQKRATEAEQEARQAARERYSQFKHTVRAIFSQDPAIIRLLGLHPPVRSNGHGDGNGNGPGEDQDHAVEQTNGSQLEPVPSAPGRVSQTIAAELNRWRGTWANALHLEPGAQARLADKGWPVERLTESAAMVETVATLISKQQEAMQAYNNQRQATKGIELELRRWFKEGRALIRLAVQQAEGQSDGEVRRLVGV